MGAYSTEGIGCLLSSTASLSKEELAKRLFNNGDRKWTNISP